MLYTKRRISVQLEEKRNKITEVGRKRVNENSYHNKDTWTD